MNKAIAKTTRLAAVIFASMLSAASVTSVAAEQPSGELAAKSAPPRMLVYINPNEYTHSAALSDFFYHYWFSQGPDIEALAMEKLGAQYGDVGMCEGYSSARAVVWIKPSIFYNPKMGTYYGKIVAEVFSGSGKSLGTFTARAEHTGWIDVNTAGQIKATYTSAMNGLVQQMAASSSIQNTLDAAVTGNENSVPCANVSLLSKTAPSLFSY